MSKLKVADFNEQQAEDNKFITANTSDIGARMKPGMYLYVYDGINEIIGDGDAEELHKPKSTYIGPIDNLALSVPEYVQITLRDLEDVEANDLRSKRFNLSKVEKGLLFQGYVYKGYTVLTVDEADTAYNNTTVDTFDKLHILGAQEESIKTLKEAIWGLKNAIYGLTSRDMTLFDKLYVGRKMLQILSLFDMNEYKTLFPHKKAKEEAAAKAEITSTNNNLDALVDTRYHSARLIVGDDVAAPYQVRVTNVLDDAMFTSDLPVVDSR